MKEKKIKGEKIQYADYLENKASLNNMHKMEMYNHL